MNVLIFCTLFFMTIKLNCETLTSRKFSHIFDDCSELFNGYSQSNEKAAQTNKTNSYVKPNEIYKQRRWDNKE